MSDVLNALKQAKDILSTRGRIRGDYFEGTLDGPMCLMGACCYRADSGVFNISKMDVLAVALGFANEIGGETGAATRATRWNDDPDTTDEMVLARLDEAIAREESNNA